MRSDKSLYHIQFGLHNVFPAVFNAMTHSFDHEDQWVAFNNFTYIVYTDRAFEELRLMIGVHMEADIDDFMIMKLDYETAMSTFTDRHDIIGFLKCIKMDVDPAPRKSTQTDVDYVLDKISSHGIDSLDPDELRILSDQAMAGTDGN